MSFLRGSTNYVWCTTSVLGKGATGAVFQGVNKHNGETVAVKTFNQLSHMRPQEVQMREFEVLQKVKHENIVKLLAIEEEQEGRGKVIVMELCTGGSLFNLLDDPENNFGLDEDEWLLVLSHLSAGMNHLRDNNLVHRDLKPGNIMKFIKDDGAIVYKLTDFGAARELQDDQQFVSLYGTEEYLHPDMYERAVLRKPVGKTFGATVDLWSIGVTLYHVATGNLPFRPFGGRRNKETMYYITTKKASGVISGVQTSENGPIQWSKDLPNTCLLSLGIKKHITPLLAGLLEVNPQKMWTFEKFFSEVTRILSKKKIHIYFMTKLTEHRVYLDKEEKLDQFQLLLNQQTEVSPSSQILIYDKLLLGHYVDDSTPGTSFPDTTRAYPILLFSKENHNVSLGIDKELPPFPTLPNLVSVENDATLAKSACAVGYAFQRKIESYGHCSEIVSKAVKMLSEVIIAHLERLQDVLDRCKVMTKLAQNQLELFSISHSNQGKVLQVFDKKPRDDSLSSSIPEDEHLISGPKIDNKLDQIVIEEELRFKDISQQLSELSPAITQLFKRCVSERQLLNEWDEAIRDVPSLTSCAARSRTYVAKLKESWQHLLRDRASRTLTYNDEQFHILEKIKMQETMRDLVDLHQKNCYPTVNQLTEILADWYKMAQTTYLQIEILHKDTINYQSNLEMFSLLLKDAIEKYSGLLKETIGSIVDQHNEKNQKLEEEKSRHVTNTRSTAQVSNDPAIVNGVTKSSRQSKTQVRRALRSILRTQDEVWGILHENYRLIEHFGQLAVGTPQSDQSTQQILAEVDTAEKYC